jgi:NAD(P)-dependent dehydrogenase (short-subunit alcohol dehydrogenase family)
MPDLFSVEGKVTLVTGASSGLGAHCARVLHAAGAQVVGLSRSLGEFQEMSDRDHAAFLGMDLSEEQDWSQLGQQICGYFGPPDIIVNAAGVNLRRHDDDTSPEDWATTIALNLTAPFFLAQALVPEMKKKGFGRIINFASLQSERAFKNGLAYGATKGGVAQMTRAMAESWSAQGVNTNALAPGFFPTQLTAPVFGDVEASTKLAEQTCIGRNGQMTDIDGPLLFLSSAASAYVTGQLLYVDGGFTAK